jgi:catechol 2,3-dioxygenase-like lactoylglutathione lyase family enzyme
MLMLGGAPNCAFLRKPKDQCASEECRQGRMVHGDLCFLASIASEEVVAHLKANGVAIKEGPVNMQGARGVIRSVYCRDPDG